MSEMEKLADAIDPRKADIETPDGHSVIIGCTLADLIAASEVLHQHATALEIGRGIGREEAAKVCDELAARYETRADRHVVDHNRDGMLEWSARWNAALNAAAAIRAVSPALDVEGMVEIGARAAANVIAARHGDKNDYWLNDERREEARAVLASLGVKNG